MDCPVCGCEMTKGEFAIQGSIERFLAAGLSWDSLWFRHEGGARRDRKLVLDIGTFRHGWRCQSCGASLLRGPSTASV